MLSASRAFFDTHIIRHFTYACNYRHYITKGHLIYLAISIGITPEDCIYRGKGGHLRLAREDLCVYVLRLRLMFLMLF